MQAGRPASPTAAGLLDTATTLAFERTRVAYERTMMAWTRTATSLITFGFSVYKFFEFELKNSPSAEMIVGPRAFGLALIVMGLLTMLFGSMEHARDLRWLRSKYVGMPKSFSSVVAITVAVLGLCALVAVVLRA
jgi:putative membrane protein